MKLTAFPMQVNLITQEQHGVKQDELAAFNEGIIATFHHEPCGGLWLDLKGQNHDFDPASGIDFERVVIESEEHLDEVYKALKALFKTHKEGMGTTT